MAFRLQFEDTNGTVSQTIAFSDGEISVGRSDECTVTLDSNSVSRKHARFFIHLGRPYIEDLHSANGVVVDGEKIRGMHALTPASVVLIGDHIARFEADPVALQARVGSAIRTADAVRAWTPTFIRLDSDFEGERVLPVDGNAARIGRSSSAQVHVIDASVSRLHAEVRIEGPSVILSDLSSANGTFVDGQLISHPTMIGERTVVHVGDVPLVFTGTPSQLDWTDVEIPTPGTPPSRPTLLLVVAAALAATIIVGAALVIMLARTSDEPEVDAIAAASAAMNVGDWHRAAAAYEDALEEDPSNQNVVALLGHTRREASGADALDACNEQLQAAEALQFGDDTVAAVEAFNNLLACYRAIDENTAAFADAAEAVQVSVLPPLVELRRLNGLQAVETGNFDAALEHLREAVRLQEARNADPVPVRAELRTAYLRAGVAAVEAENWSRAASMLSQANELQTLDPQQTAQLTSARAQAARQR